eukprot:scaffold1837_cov102-Isochrysis_galbana.AAC.3
MSVARGSSMKRSLPGAGMEKGGVSSAGPSPAHATSHLLKRPRRGGSNLFRAGPVCMCHNGGQGRLAKRAFLVQGEKRGGGAMMPLPLPPVRW